VVKEEMELDLECDVVLGKGSEKKKGPEMPKEAGDGERFSALLIQEVH
jgi:hypothetical protein